MGSRRSWAAPSRPTGPSAACQSPSEPRAYASHVFRETPHNWMGREGNVYGENGRRSRTRVYTPARDDLGGRKAPDRTRTRFPDGDTMSNEQGREAGRAGVGRRGFITGGAAALGGIVLGGCAGSSAHPLAAAARSSSAEAEAGKPEVFFSQDLSPAALVEIYSRVGRSIGGRVAIKVHTGEPNGPNILPRDLVKALQQRIPESCLVETNTLYRGKRFTTAEHRETIAINGWNFCRVDILDEDGATTLPVRGGRRFKETSVGKHLLDYDALVVLTHFKGHAMGGYGGSLKNIAIGCADGRIGKKAIHAAPDDVNYAAWLKGEPFQENMVEAAKAVVDHFGPRIVFINVLRNMSVDCDCAGVTAAPVKARDLGILASTDLLAVEQASIDLVYRLPEAELHDLRERIETRQGLHQLAYMKTLAMGNDQYRLVTI